MTNVSHESLICSDLNTTELKRIQSCDSHHRSEFDSAIMIDSYKELPHKSRRGSSRRSSSVHLVYKDPKYDADSNEKESATTLSYIYKKIAALFFVFNRFTLTDNVQNGMPVVSDDRNLATIMRSFNLLYDLRLKDKIYDTMDHLMKYNRKATDRLVAMITSVPLNLDRFDFYKYFSNFDYSLSDCFALFIEQAHEEPGESPVAPSALDDIPDNLKCEFVNKHSREVISESGPYKCLYEQSVDSIADDSLLDEMLRGVAVKKGKVRFFHKIKNLGKKDSKHMRPGTSTSLNGGAGNDERVNNYIKQRFSMFTEYLSKRTHYSDPPNSKWNATTYFNLFSKKSTDCPDNSLDNSARERFDEHVRMHTLHWDEVQYDDIEIVLRDNNDNSVVKLPYSCTIM